MSSKKIWNRQRHKGAWLNRIQKEVEKVWPPPLSLNINSTNIFQFLVIFAQNLAILPQKPEVTHFSEVYQTFSHFWNIIETNHSSHLLSSENSHGSQICYVTNSTITPGMQRRGTTRHWCIYTYIVAYLLIILESRVCCILYFILTTEP